MKTEQSLKRSVLASLKTAQDSGNVVMESLDHLMYAESDLGKVMPTLRKHLAELTKAVHELNAYHNCLTTD